MLHKQQYKMKGAEPDEGRELVEAVQLTAENHDELVAWAGGVKTFEIDAIDENKKYPAINMLTEEGPYRASEGQYVIRHMVSGTFFVLDPNLFEAGMERADG